MVKTPLSSQVGEAQLTSVVLVFVQDPALLHKELAQLLRRHEAYTFYS
jgi:hypothetical protein